MGKKVAVLISILIITKVNLVRANGIIFNRPIKETWYTCESETVTLTGLLVTERAYGPPNYGENPETDKKEYFPVFKLSDPISIKAESKDELNGEPLRGIKEIQLVIQAQDGFDLKNRNVEVKGKLFHSITGHHHKKVLLDVEKIRAIKQ